MVFSHHNTESVIHQILICISLNNYADISLYYIYIRMSGSRKKYLFINKWLATDVANPLKYFHTKS